MHIVHLGKFYHPAVGGMESLVRQQAMSEASAGHKVSIVVINHETDVLIRMPGFEIGKSVDTIESPSEGITLHRVGRFASIAKLDVSSSLNRTLKIVSAANPSVWHLHTPNATMLASVRLLDNLCQPLIVSHHSDILNQRILRPGYELMESAVYQTAKCIISDSDGYIGGSKRLTAHRSKVVSIPLGIATEAYTNPTSGALEWRDRFRAQYGNPIWLSVGRLAKYKGLDVSIHALQKIEGNYLVIGIGPEQQRLQSLASSLGVADRISWLGKCSADQVHGAYLAATALWFPSNQRNEGFGIVQVEAMASGCPVINTDIPNSGVSWVSQHQITGLTVPMNNSDALAESARSLMQNSALRHQYAKSAVIRAQNLFDEEAVTKQRLSLYSTVI